MRERGASVLWRWWALYRLFTGILALCGGLADEHPTLGAGLSFKVLQIDAAYAYENFVGGNANFFQLKLGW